MLRKKTKQRVINEYSNEQSQMIKTGKLDINAFRDQVPDCFFNSSTACNFSFVFCSSFCKASIVCFASLSTARVLTILRTFVFAEEKSPCPNCSNKTN